jgi:hypothetical protein
MPLARSTPQNLSLVSRAQIREVAIDMGNLGLQQANAVSEPMALE